jgi:hypothetical protein
MGLLVLLVVMNGGLLKWSFVLFEWVIGYLSTGVLLLTQVVSVHNVDTCGILSSSPVTGFLNYLKH